jgi:ligand-binding sensor domain-containing protein/two-component sensor histidine kinase
MPVISQTIIQSKANQYRFTNYSLEDGLSNENIFDIFQDKLGYIWIATEDGLNRFDGYKFEIYRNVPGDFKSISSNFITDINEDPEGNLWIATNNGLNKYDREHELFIKYFHQYDDTNSLSNNYIKAFEFSTDSCIWLETVDGVLNRFDVKNNSFTRFKHLKSNQEYYNYHSVFIDPEGNIWIGGRGIYPHKLLKEKKTFVKYHNSVNDSLKKRENDVTCFFIDSKKQFWVTGLDGAYIMKSDDTFIKQLPKPTYDIIEDKYNRLWFSTSQGVFIKNKSDKKYLQIKKNPYHSSSLISNHTKCLLLDRKGNIWIGTTEGISYYSFTRERYSFFEHEIDNEQSLSDNIITAVAEDSSQNLLWIGTSEGGLNKFDMQTNVFQRFSHSKKSNSILSNHISALLLDNNTLWIGHWAGIGFDKMNTKTNHFEHHRFNLKNTYSDWYNGFLKHNNDSVFIALWGENGIMLYDNKKNDFAQPPMIATIIPNKNKITQIEVVDENLFFFLDNNNRLVLYDKRKHDYSCFINSSIFDSIGRRNNAELQSDKYAPQYLPFNSKILEIEYGDNTLYIATRNGLYSYEIQSERFQAFQKNNIISNSEIKKLVFDSKNKILWILTKSEILAYQNVFNKLIPFHLTQKIKIDDYPNTSIKILDNKLIVYDLNTLSIYDIKSLKDHHEFLMKKHKINDGINDIIMFNNRLTIASKNSIYSIRDDKIERIKKLDNTKINCMYADGKQVIVGSNGHLLLMDTVFNFIEAVDQINLKIDTTGIIFNSIDKIDNLHYAIGSNLGLFMYKSKIKQLNYVRKNEIDYTARFLHLANDFCKGSHNDIWIATTKTGLKHYYINTNTLLSYDSDILDSSAIWGTNSNYVFQDKDSNIWLAAYGITKLNSKGKVLKHFTKDDGLSSNKIHSIVQDRSGNIWFTTANGLSFLKYNSNRIHTVSFNYNTKIRYTKCSKLLNNGSLFFGTKSGFYIFHPDSIISKKAVVNPQIVAFYVNDIKKGFYENYNKTINLDYAENTISFEFAALNFDYAQSIKYRYRMLGLDETWIEADSRGRNVRYAKLPSGEYTFQLLASNELDKWSKNPLNFKISIKSPFWLQWWFISLITIIIIIILSLLIYARELKNRNIHKSIILEQQLLRSQMNPHFIFNSLNAIQSYILENKPIEAASYLSRFSNLVRLILNNSRTSAISLSQEIDTLQIYLELQQIRFENKFHYELNIDNSIDTESIILPPMLMQPFIENSIEHAFVGTELKGFIHIRFNIVDQHLVISVEDNGIGINKSLQNKATKEEYPKTHESLATQITKSRINTINKNRKQKIILSIQDRSAFNEKGTQIIIRIPL